MPEHFVARNALPAFLCALAPALPACAPAAADLDGPWRAVSIAGQPVGRVHYTVRVADGRVVGGRDGCNAWSYVRGEQGWAIESTMIGCPEDPLRGLYFQALDPEGHRLAEGPNGTLVVSARGTSAVFRRAQEP